jgi:hypothetical protein
MEAAGAVDAKNAPTAPWKTHRTDFPQLPQAIIILATEREVTARLCHSGDREAVTSPWYAGAPYGADIDCR